MANTAQAAKRARQAEDHRQQNVSKRSQLGTSVKKVVKAIEAGDKTQAEAAYKAAVPVLDKMTGKGIIHKNAAARQKSRLNSRIRTM